MIVLNKKRRARTSIEIYYIRFLATWRYAQKLNVQYFNLINDFDSADVHCNTERTSGRQ